jgi:hypothetical protein
MDGFRGEVERGANAAARETNPKVPVEADTTKARRQIKELEDERGNKVVDLDLDAKGFREKLAAETRPTKVKVKVDYDESALDRTKKNIDRFLTDEGLAIGRAQQRLGQAMRSWSPTAVAGRQLADMEKNFNLKPHLDEHEIEEMRLRLAAERFTIKVKMEKDNASLHNLVNSAERDLDNIFNKHLGNNRGGILSGLLGGIGGAASNVKFPDLIPNIGGLGGFGSIAIIVGGLSLLAPALALVSQALVGLPALVTGFALPLGVAALGFKGIKKALDDSGILKDDQPLGKDGKPKGKAKQGLGTVLSELQTNVSDVFATGLKPVFQQIAGVIPQLTRGLPFVAQGLVHMAEGLGNIMATPAFTEGFDRFTNSVGTMLTNLSPALQLFTSGMSNLIVNVGDHLPGLANTMTQWAGEFQSWVDRISKPKQLNGKDLPNSSDLDQAITNLKPTLNGIKDFIGDLLNKGLELAKDPNLIHGITDFLTGLEHLAEQIARMGPVFESLASILKLIPSAPTDDKGKPIKPTGVPNPDPNYVRHEDRPKPADAGGKGWFDKIMDANSSLWGSLPQKVMDFFDDSNPDHFRNQPKNLSIMGAGGSQQAPIPVTPVAPNNPALNALLLPTLAPKAQTPPPMIPGVQGATQPPIQPPKIEAPKIPPGSEKIWEPLIQATAQAGAQINAEVSSWQGKIKSALDGAAAGASASGQAIGAQLAAGIRAGEGAAVDAAHHLADAVKGALPHSPAEHGPFAGSGWTAVKTSGTAIASQFADGLDGGFDGIVAASQRLMDAVHGSMTEQGILPPQLTAAVQKESAAIGIELDKLKAQRDALDPKDKAGRAAIKSQMDQLRSLRDEFGLNTKESKYASKYGGAEGPFTAQNVGSMITQQIAAGLNGALGFGKANLSQLETDLGMSGNGVVEQLGDYGINFLSSGLNSLAQGFFGGGKQGNTFNFNSMDHDGMMQDYKRVQNRESMAFTQRTN